MRAASLLASISNGTFMNATAADHSDQSVPTVVSVPVFSDTVGAGSSVSIGACVPNPPPSLWSAASTTPPPQLLPPLARLPSSRPLRPRQTTPTVPIPARRTAAAATRAHLTRPSQVRALERADSIEAVQRLADEREREQVKMSPSAERPMRTHRRIASGRENIPPPSSPSAVVERGADVPTMYDTIKRKTACFAIHQTNSGVTLTPAPARSRPTSSTATREETEEKGKQEKEESGVEHNVDTSKDSVECSDDEQPGAVQPVVRKERKSHRLSRSNSTTRSKRKSTSSHTQKQQRGMGNEYKQQKVVTDSGRSSSIGSNATTPREIVHSRPKSQRAVRSKKADGKPKRQSRSGSASPPTSPFPPALSSTPRQTVRLLSSSELYVSPILSSAGISLPSIGTLTPFSNTFHSTLSAAARPTFVQYLVASAEDVLHRVRYILHRDGTNQNHLARCLNISPATLSPMLRGVYDHLKTKHLSMMRAWAAQTDVRYVQSVVGSMRLWCLSETDWSRECSMTLVDIRRWLHFDMPLTERNEADRSIVRWINECKHATDVLMNETVMQQFQSDYVSAVHGGQLDVWQPAELVKTNELDNVQHEKDEEAAKLDEDERKGADTIVLNIPQLTKQPQHFKQKDGKKRNRAEELTTDSEQQNESVEEGEDWKKDDAEASSAVVGRYSKKQKSAIPPQQLPVEQEERVRLEVDNTGSLTPVSCWHHVPTSAFGGSTPVSFISSVARLDGDGKPSTFFYFDPNADMAQVADRWSVPAVPVLPAFSSHTSSTAELSTMRSRIMSAASASISTPAAPALSSEPFAGRAFGSSAGDRSSTGSDSSPFTPTIFLTVSSPSSSSAPMLAHPPAVFFTPAPKASDSSMLLNERGSTGSGITTISNPNSSLSSLPIRSLSSILPTPLDVSNTSHNTSASVSSITNTAYSRHSVDKNELPLARQLDLTDEDDTSKYQHEQRQQQQQLCHNANQQLELSHLMLSMSTGKGLQPLATQAESELSASR